MKTKILCGIIIILLISISLSLAQEFRSLKAIPTPAPKKTHFRISKRRPGYFQPVSEKVVRKSLETILSSWNTAQMSSYLSDDFYDKDRLMDSISRLPCKNARLRLMAIQEIQTLDQHIVPLDENYFVRISTVSVIAKTQLEYNDPAKGFQNIEGINEYILKIRELIREKRR